MSSSEEYLNESMFEKPRGERRWLGKEHHRGKERLHNAVKDRTFIEKTVRAEQPIGKNRIRKLVKCTNDELQLNVVYSLDKKKRWRDADTISLMKGTPENVNTEVVEKNALEMCGFMYPSKSTFAVHSKQVNAESTPGEFDIRSATSSGKGQDYSNFLPKSRELSKKADPRKKDASEEDVAPVVSYNIYRTHPSREVVGSAMFREKVISKSGRHRTNKKLDLEVYFDEDYSEYDEFDLEESDYPKRNLALNLSNFFVEKRNKQCRKKRRDTEESYEIIDDVLLEQKSEFSKLMNIPRFLGEEEYTFLETDVILENLKMNFDSQIENLREVEDFEVKKLRDNQCLVDVSGWCNRETVRDGETSTVIVFTKLKDNQYNVLLNSTVRSHPAKNSPAYLRNLISNSITLREAILKIAGEIAMHRMILESMKLSLFYFPDNNLKEMANDSAQWESQMVNVDWPNKYHHANWASSQQLSTMAARLDWTDLKMMTRNEKKMNAQFPTEEKCEVCREEKRAHTLFYVGGEAKVQCTRCLRNDFYKELGARRLPVDLQISTWNEFECLPTFIPLRVLNLYIRMMAENNYKILGDIGSFEKCPSCNSTIYFEDNVGNIKTPNKACPCGYSWCSLCEKVPHWPMDCRTFAEWDRMWILTNAVANSQGTGTETLLQIACPCGKCIYNVLMPEAFVRCPFCRACVNLGTMKRTIIWPDRAHLLVGRGLEATAWHYDRLPYIPRVTKQTQLSTISKIDTAVWRSFEKARDVRFDLKRRNEAVHREHLLIKKNILKMQSVDNMLGSVSYLAENVTAWMYMKNQSNSKIKRKLKTLMDDRKTLIELLKEEDGEMLKNCLQKLRKEIDEVVEAVKSRL